MLMPHNYWNHYKTLSLSPKLCSFNGASENACEAFIWRLQSYITRRDDRPHAHLLPFTPNRSSSKRFQNQLPPRVHNVAGLRRERIFPAIPPPEGHEPVVHEPSGVPVLAGRRQASGEAEIHQHYQRSSQSWRTEPSGAGTNSLRRRFVVRNLGPQGKEDSEAGAGGEVESEAEGDPEELDFLLWVRSYLCRRLWKWGSRRWVCQSVRWLRKRHRFGQRSVSSAWSGTTIF